MHMSRTPIHRCSLALGLLLLLPPALRAQGTDPADQAWRSGDVERAAQIYSERLSRDSTDTRAAHRLALFRAWRGDRQRALALLDGVLQLEPRNGEARLDRIRVLFWDGQDARARTELVAFAASQPNNARAVEVEAQIARRAGDTRAELAALDRLIALEPANKQAARAREELLARKASRSGDNRTAEERWRLAAARYPDDPSPLVGLGMTLRWLGRTDEAIRVLEQAEKVSGKPNAAAAEQLAWARAPRASGISASGRYTHDSEGNRIATASAGGALQVSSAFRLVVNGYRRTMDAPRVTNVLSSGLSIGGELYPGHEAKLEARAGVTAPDSGDVMASWSAAATVAPTANLRLDLGLARTPYDYTHRLTVGRVVADEADFGATIEAPWRRFELGLAGTALRIHGPNDNQGFRATAQVGWRVSSPFRLGARATAYGFKERTHDGYYAPLFDRGVAAVAQWSDYPGRWDLAAEVAPGVRVRDRGADPAGSFDASGHIAYVLGIGRRVGVAAGYAASGLQTDGAVRPNYDNWSVRVYTTLAIP